MDMTAVKMRGRVWNWCCGDYEKTSRKSFVIDCWCGGVCHHLLQNLCNINLCVCIRWQSGRWSLSFETWLQYATVTRNYAYEYKMTMWCLIAAANHPAVSTAGYQSFVPRCNVYNTMFIVLSSWLIHCDIVQSVHPMNAPTGCWLATWCHHLILLCVEADTDFASQCMVEDWVDVGSYHSG